eukprot:CAMPEP_0201694524 /NCGR_PEP_ID=MMETSP0578-20130828/6754_1 /ASSEMBLY_ACC=CAM_ASM_000663 /TAXON_ID=267565 /ORGANISM="Skeletonema grethea, Strain CCMP 1804" /LENGTH=426 /DNA_ID=CAMNT_0048180211 /DNA_START=70 /DNA_END=1350 /DNA_ORIENTATION=-
MTKIDGGKQQAMSSHRGGNNNNKRKLSYLQNPGAHAAATENDNNHHLKMEAILHRYNSLAQIHYEETKRRHVESNQRTLQNTQRMQQLTTLQNLASNLLRSEQNLYRENQRERQDIEKELKKAEQEKALAEDFLSKIGSFTCNHGNSMNVMGDHLDVDIERGTIGGVPRKFLDLSHFPKLRQGEGEVYNKSEDDDDIIGCVLQENNKKRRHIIDCTEEDAQKMNLEESGCSARIPFTSPIPQGFSSQAMETTLFDGGAASKTQKKNTKRIYITDASLAHVNGTYIQEVGCCYNNGPVFVLAGPPRKFMGFDCSVVLRRERVSTEEYQSLSRDVGVVMHSKNNDGGSSTPHFIWKIGLAPAHRVTHSRMIGYYFAHEDPSDAAVMSSMDLMGEDDDSTYFEPPVDGWRVFHESGQGRTSGLKVNYEE